MDDDISLMGLWIALAACCAVAFVAGLVLGAVIF